MSKQTHTPGPWAAHRHKSTDSYTIHVAGRSWEAYAVADVGDCVQNEANARLIAASPDLLSALKAMLNWGNLGAYERADAMNAARTAVAKATGAAE